MRLLYLDESKRLKLADFRNRIIPPYAILSHRWGDAEVTFWDMAKGTYKEKDGYRKLEFCAEQAAQDGLQYFWSDTCCIDKWNLRELSTSINSMFLWYKNAEKCYAFLSDVSVSIAKETFDQRDWEASFRASKWFTRGWTLQELIAPTSVEFFTSEGRMIGDRISLKELVHDITGIPVQVLCNCPLNDFSTNDRIGWAKSRETGQPEDNAYCLLGILDVSMPATYGEGKEKAWARLFAELDAAGRAPSIIPFSQNEHFVGQGSHLAYLEAKLFSDKQTTMLAIVGSGGTGKSQLALELAYRTREKEKNCSVLWVDASDRTSIHQSYTSIAQKLNIPGWNEQNADIMKLVKLELTYRNTEPRKCLIICDNLNSAHSENLIVEHLPHSELCSIVLTTTKADMAERLAVRNVVELRELGPEAAQTMLENHLSTPVTGAERQEANLLLQELSYLPLAIIQAAAYINAEGVTLQDYRLRLHEQSEQENSSRVSEEGYGSQSPVATTLFVSMSHIRIDNALAADYLLLAACIDRKDIPLELLEVSSFEKRDTALKILSQYALITWRHAEFALEVHGLVHGALGEWLKRHRQLHTWTQYAIKQLVRVFPENTEMNRGRWTRLAPHVKHALSHCRSEPKAKYSQTLGLMSAYGLTLLSDQQYLQAEQLFLQLIEMMEFMKIGDEEPEMLSMRCGLSVCYREQGRWKEAEELQVRDLEICSRVLSEEDSVVLTGMANLSVIYIQQRKYDEAEELQERYLGLCSRIHGEEHPDTLICMSNLATIYSGQERWEEAEDLDSRVVEISERVLGEEHPDTLTRISKLAIVYSTQGRWKEAEKLDLYVLKISKRVLGEEHPQTLRTMASLASRYRYQERWKKANILSGQVMDISAKVLGWEHPDTLNAISNLADTYVGLGRWEKVETLYRELWEIRRLVLGEGHQDTLRTMGTLAVNLKVQHKREEAIRLLEACCQLHKHYLGEQFPSTRNAFQVLEQWHEEDRIDLVLVIARKVIDPKM
jgi:tetratricopeptide (TPR) repeat protein